MDRSRDRTAEPGIAFDVFDTHDRMSEAAADAIVDAAEGTQDLLWCVATGSTPTDTYELLAERPPTSTAPVRNARILKLDEWGGLAVEDPATCEQYLRRHVLGPLGVPEHHYVGFESDPDDPEAECQRIRQWLAEHGPIDLCLLGLGRNGHLGLNEPGPSLEPFSHVADLSAHSQQHRMLDEAERPPRYGLTLGLAEILQARQILLLVSGSRKQEALDRLVQPEVSTQFPASFLWMHPQVRCLCDHAAAPSSLSSH